MAIAEWLCAAPRTSSSRSIMLSLLVPTSSAAAFSSSSPLSQLTLRHDLVLTPETKLGHCARTRVVQRREKYNSVQVTAQNVERNHPNSPANSELPARDADKQEAGNVETFIQERAVDGLVRRYWLDDVSGVLKVEVMKISSSNRASKNYGIPGVSNTEALQMPFGVLVPKIITDFLLPAGFPDSVSGDYLQYMLWQFPTNVTAWICSTLVTSSLFKAVGVGIGGGYAAAATAAIKWVTKDGLGALGLLFIGGRFGTIFDEDPKQWRMYADFIGSAGSIFELCTPLAPDQFLLLASLGHLTKAVAKGLKDPSFRVIQNHFAVVDNVGDVSAKEEVWEVSAKLVGLSLAVLLLGMPGLSSSYWSFLLIWALLRLLHLWLRYQSLSVVRFSTINYKRAAVLVGDHLTGNTVPGCEVCNKREKLLIWWQLMSPRVWIGCSLKDVLKNSPSTLEVEELLKLYKNEDYILVLYPNSTHGHEARVLAKEGATSMGILRSLWQAYWLLLPSVAKSRLLPSPDYLTSNNFVTSSDISNEVSSMRGQMTILSRSLEAMDWHFSTFLKELEVSGWDLDQIVLKVPSNAPLLIRSYCSSSDTQS